MDKFSELKEALEWLEKTPYGGEWDSALVGGENGKNYHAITNADDEVVRTADDSRQTSWLCDYLEAVSPVNIRALLAELDEPRQLQNSIVLRLKMQRSASPSWSSSGLHAVRCSMKSATNWAATQTTSRSWWLSMT